MSHYCIYSANYLPSYGGVEKFTSSISQELASQGHIVSIVTNNIYGLSEIEKSNDKITIYRLPCVPLVNGRLPIPKLNSQFRQLNNRLKSTKFDYVIINSRFYPHSLLAARHAQEAKITPILIEHGSCYLTFGNRALDMFVKAYEHLITSKLKRFHIAYYAVSKSGIKWLKTFGINGKGVINNSIDADRFFLSASDRDFRKEYNIPGDHLLVAFTGRFVPEKGVKELLETAKSMKNDNTVHFIMAGDGPLLSDIEKSNPGNMHFTGKIASPDIAALLRQGDIFCLPTRSEGFSTSLLEAAACYDAPIITEVGGVEELIPSGDYGIVIKSQSSNEIVSAINQLKKSPSSRIAIAERIGKRVREYFSWEKTSKLIIQACEEANATEGEIPNE